MQPDVPKPGSPADWLRHARNDLALAGVPLPKFAFYNSLCFHAQQAVLNWAEQMIQMPPQSGSNDAT